MRISTLSKIATISALLSDMVLGSPIVYLDAPRSGALLGPTIDTELPDELVPIVKRINIEEEKELERRAGRFFGQYTDVDEEETEEAAPD
ncbi:hypothetical protein C8J57DRAFT_1344624, partial [Mycena rebaudengoi]